MDAGEFEQYVSGRYQREVAWYDARATSNQRWYMALQWPLVILAALVPVLIALGGDAERWAAIGVSAGVAVAAGALKTFKYEEHWLNYRTTCETLRKEIHFYRARIHVYEQTADPEGLFVERVESLISRENTLWLTAHKENANKHQDEEQ